VRDPQILEDRLVSRAITTRLVTPSYIRYLYTNDRFFEITKRMAAVSPPINSDSRPICFQYAASLWLSKFFPRLLGAGDSDSKSPFVDNRRLYTLFGAALLAAFLFLRRWQRARLVVFVAVAGFCGMLLETLLILAYQVKRGVIYQDIGLLLTLFMAGLALGATVTSRLMSVQERRKKPSRRLVGSGLIIGFCMMSVLVAWWVSAGGGVNLFSVGSWLVLSGFFVAAVFAYASSAATAAQQRMISPLYAADVVGGALGTVAGSLLWIPVVGLSGTAWLASLICLLSSVLV
jgi:hypothetical protein